jgi:hypothetical protein
MPMTPGIPHNGPGDRYLPFGAGRARLSLWVIFRPATPVTIVSDPLPLDEVPPGVREDVHLLRIEEGTRDKFSFSLCTPVLGPIRLGPIRLVRREKPPGLHDCLPDESETIQFVEAAANAEEVLPKAIQTERLIREQARDKECKNFAAFAGLDWIFNFNADGLLVRIAPLYKAKQIVDQASLRPRLLHLEHCPKTAGHPGSTRMFRSMRRRFFWPKMAQDVAETVSPCAT